MFWRNVTAYFLFLPLLLGSCVVRQPAATPSENQEKQFRGFNIPVEMWNELPPDDARAHIGRILNIVALSNYNVILFEMPPQQIPSETGKGVDASADPVAWAIDEAHRLELKFYFSVKIPSPEEPEITQNDPARSMADKKSRLKDQVHDLAMNYDVNGFLFDLSEFQLAGNRNDLSPAGRPMYDVTGDLLEDLSVEGMLLKPYLVFLGAFPAETATSFQPENWLKNGFIDGLVPVQSPDDVNDAARSTVHQAGGFRGNVFHGIRIERENQLPEIPSIENSRGMILFPDKNSVSPMNYSLLTQISFKDKMDLPDSIKITRPSQVFSLDLSPVTEGEKAGTMVDIFPAGKIKLTDSNGRIGFIDKTPPDTLILSINGREIKLGTGFWMVPYDYIVDNDGKVSRESPWIEFRQAPDPVAHDPEFHLLCKTAWPAKAWINGDTVKVYETGIFFKTVRFAEGLNRIEAGVLTGDSSHTTYTQEIIYVQESASREPYPLWIDERSITPRVDLVLLREDRVHVSFRGSRGQHGQVVFHPGNRFFRCSRTDQNDFSIYEAEIPLNEWETGRRFALSLVLMPEERERGSRGLEIATKASVTIRNKEAFPRIRVAVDNTRLTYNLGAVRLGGPIKAEFPGGVVMQSNGIYGDQYRVFLNREEEGFVQMENVEVLSSSYSSAPFFITSLSCGPSDSADIVSIPYPEPVPYAIFPEPELKRIRIRLYGAKTSSTWISHRRGCRMIERITWEQATPETYEVQVYLKTSAIWGYDLAREGNSLAFRVKYPPEYDPTGKIPLSGLKIAIEAGHGGESYGAMGLSGLLEKDINLDLAHRFGAYCRSKGAEVFQVRNTDSTMALLDKRALARNSGADLLISIHANAAGTSRGYLGVSGTSTYYHNPFWAEFAESMYNNLLDMELDEFGVVGSFNYTVIRNSELPSILVEQAFMTHAEDEEKLARPAFRQAMAENMYKGLIEYLKFMKKEQP